MKTQVHNWHEAQRQYMQKVRHKRVMERDTEGDRTSGSYAAGDEDRDKTEEQRHGTSGTLPSEDFLLSRYDAVVHVKHKIRSIDTDGSAAKKEWSNRTIHATRFMCAGQ